MTPDEINSFNLMADAIAGMDMQSGNLKTRIPGALHRTAGIGSLLNSATVADQITITSHMRELTDLAKLVSKQRKHTEHIVGAFPYRDTFPHLATFIDANRKFFAYTAELQRRATSLRASFYVHGSMFYSGTLADASMRALDLYIARFNEYYLAMTVALRSQRGTARVDW